MPRAITLVLSGDARILCIPVYLVSPLITIFILYIANDYFPFFIDKVYAKAGIALGFVIFFGRYFFSHEMKLTMETDFNIFMNRYMTNDSKMNHDQTNEDNKPTDDGMDDLKKQVIIIDAYGAILEKKKDVYTDENLLPIPKNELFNIIKKVYHECLHLPEDKVLSIFHNAQTKTELLQQLKNSAIFLSQFVDKFTADNLSLVNLEKLMETAVDKNLAKHFKYVTEQSKKESEFYLNELEKFEEEE